MFSDQLTSKCSSIFVHVHPLSSSIFCISHIIPCWETVTMWFRNDGFDQRRSSPALERRCEPHCNFECLFLGCPRRSKSPQFVATQLLLLYTIMLSVPRITKHCKRVFVYLSMSYPPTGITKIIIGHPVFERQLSISLINNMDLTWWSHMVPWKPPCRYTSGCQQMCVSICQGSKFASLRSKTTARG